MTEKKLYVCDICGTGYANKADAAQCEKKHYRIPKIKKPIYKPNDEYPMKIDIEFSNGKVIRYHI